VNCPKCGFYNKSQAKLCGSCGNRMKGASAPPARKAPLARPPAYRPPARPAVPARVMTPRPQMPARPHVHVKPPVRRDEEVFAVDLKPAFDEEASFAVSKIEDEEAFAMEVTDEENAFAISAIPDEECFPMDHPGSKISFTSPGTSEGVYSKMVGKEEDFLENMFSRNRSLAEMFIMHEILSPPRSRRKQKKRK